MKTKVWVVSATEQEGEWLNQRQIGSLARRMDLEKDADKDLLALDFFSASKRCPNTRRLGPATSPSPWLVLLE